MKLLLQEDCYSYFFLVLVLGVISFIYRDFISNSINTGRWFTLDKYEVVEDCSM